MSGERIGFRREADGSVSAVAPGQVLPLAPGRYSWEVVPGSVAPWRKRLGQEVSPAVPGAIFLAGVTAALGALLFWCAKSGDDDDPPARPRAEPNAPSQVTDEKSHNSRLKHLNESGFIHSAEVRCGSSGVVENGCERISREREPRGRRADRATPPLAPDLAKPQRQDQPLMVIVFFPARRHVPALSPSLIFWALTGAASLFSPLANRIISSSGFSNEDRSDSPARGPPAWEPF